LLHNRKNVRTAQRPCRSPPRRRSCAIAARRWPPQAIFVMARSHVVRRNIPGGRTQAAGAWTRAPVAPRQYLTVQP
jgi:hypothetical protein